MWRVVLWQKLVEVSDEHTASIFGGGHEVWGSTFLWIISKFLPSYTASCLKVLLFSIMVTCVNTWGRDEGWCPNNSLPLLSNSYFPLFFTDLWVVMSTLLSLSCLHASLLRLLSVLSSKILPHTYSFTAIKTFSLQPNFLCSPKTFCLCNCLMKKKKSCVGTMISKTASTVWT